MSQSLLISVENYHMPCFFMEFKAILVNAYTNSYLCPTDCQHWILNKDADPSGQIYRLTCVFVVCKWHKRFSLNLAEFIFPV